MTGWRRRLDDAGRSYGLAAPQIERLATLLELVRDHPAAPTTVRDPEEGLDRHVLDSLSALELPEVRSARVLADVGSGAGFPGLPLAIALPDAEVTLVESVGRKCAFLESVAAAARVSNARVACRRIEEWSGDELDLVCVRALAPLPVLVEYAAPVLRIGGALVAWKGRPGAAEVRAGDAAAHEVGLRSEAVHDREPLPGAEHRRLYVYVKQTPTPARFPRRPGIARKRPLGMCNNSATDGG